MTRFEDCVELITIVAEALGRYRAEVVFVGGSVAGLLMSSKVHDVRPTDDVDVVVEAASYGKYNDLLALKSALNNFGISRLLHISCSRER